MRARMQRYYDEMSIDCQGCYFLRDGSFPDGRPYKCCRYYGYILHESKGVSDEHCSMRMTKEQGEAYMQEMASKETKRRKRR